MAMLRNSDASRFDSTSMSPVTCRLLPAHGIAGVGMVATAGARVLDSPSTVSRQGGGLHRTSRSRAMTEAIHRGITK